MTVAVWQDEVIQKYSLSSVTLEKFFVGPLPEFHVSGSSHLTPSTTKLPAVNGCLTVITDLNLTTANDTGIIVNDMGVIDLTEDDVEDLSVKKPSNATAKKHTANNSSVVQNNNHKKAGWFCFCDLFT